MRPVPLILLLLLTILLQSYSLFAQRIHGTIRDTARDSVLRSATVAIYKAKDSALLAVGLTDGNGEFSLTGLPANIPLRLVASFIGFDNSERQLTLTPAIHDYNAGTIGLKPRSQLLTEVVVAPPPVRMKGDTLEFNADAFKLNPIAQVEDLLRVLPGVVMWMADGSITVNGKKIAEVLVNGKPFFGADPKIALQNLPKNIVEKIQVYQRVSTDPEKKDSSNILDIRLKKGKESGYFGKLDAGYGTGGHYESDANLNYFNGRNQLGAAFTSNNVNKVQSDMTAVLRNNTFKGTGSSLEYQSDFHAPGVNTFTSAGAILQHDFIDSASYFHQNQLSGVYFYKNNQRYVDQTTQTLTTVNDSTQYNASNTSQTHSTTEGQNANLEYKKTFGFTHLTVDGAYNSNNTNSTGSQQSQTADGNNLPLSQQSTYNSSKGQNNTYGISANLDRFAYGRTTNWNTYYSLYYNARFTNSSMDQTTRNSYTVNADSSQNLFIDRLYHPMTSGTDQRLTFALPYASKLLTGSTKTNSLTIGLHSGFDVNTHTNNNDVFDINPSTNALTTNDTLSNRQHDLGYDITPGISLGKSWGSSAKKHPRWRSNISANAGLNEDFHGYNSWSVQTIQDLSRTWQNFTPTASLYLSLEKPKVTRFTIQTSFDVDMIYPTLQQLAPLVDNSNPTYIQYGNIGLKAQKMDNAQFTLSGSSLRPATAFIWALKVKGSASDSYLTASTVIDSLGNTRYTPVNAAGYRRLYISLQLDRAFHSNDPAKIQVQATILPEFSIDHSPRYVNQLLSYYNNYNVVVTPTLSFNYKDQAALSVHEREGWARSTQTNQSTEPLVNHTSSTDANGWIKITPAFTIFSNVSYTTNTSSASPRQAFTLWNASASYRVFKDQTGEIKFAALDLLHQNTGLINTATDNVIVHGDTNLLRQYFMVTLAWHPRKFGGSTK